MFRNERPGVFRHRYPLHSEKTSEFPSVYPPSFPLRRAAFFPRRRILINRFPNQGFRPFFRHPTSLMDCRPITRPMMSPHYAVPEGCNDSILEKVEQPDMQFVYSNNSEKFHMDPILQTAPALHKDNLGANNPAVFGRENQISDDLWIETTAPNGRVYYYNASSRVSRWDKPDNAKIMNLDHIRVLVSGPHISPMQNANIEQTYTPLNQQPHIRFFPPPQVIAGMSSGLHMFPPPNLNTPPPFHARPTPTPNMLDISQFPGYNSDFYADTLNKEEATCSAERDIDTWTKEDAVGNADRHKTFSSHENIIRNQPYFEDTLKNKQTSNETIKIFEQKEFSIHKIHENDSEDIIMTDQTQEEQLHLNEHHESIPEFEKESKIGNSLISDPFLNNEDGSQNFVSRENFHQTSGQENISETIIKPVDRSRPVSSTPVPGSKWCVVWTGDDKVFFYNADSKVSIWEMPTELKNRTDVQKLVESPPVLIMKNKQSGADTLPKKIKIEQDKIEDENQIMDCKNTEALIHEAVKKREELSHETRVQMFLQMLSEKKVSAFSTMEKELHKVVFDSRYLLLPPKERKQRFELYLREISEEERDARKKQALKVKDEYKTLLQDVGVTENTRFVDFANEHSKDPRFKALDKFKDREVLFNEYVSNLRKESLNLHEKRKSEFLELIKEQNYVYANIQWQDVKKFLCFDDRYSAIRSDSEREKLFNEYIQKSSPFKFQSANEKEDRINISIKTRKQEVQRELSFHLKELNKERENHKFDAIVNRFKALLADLVKKPSVSWREAKKMLRADHRWSEVSDLSDEKRIKYFDEHICYLIKKKREQFHQILSEIPEINLTSKWKDIKNKILDDPRCKLFSSDSRKCEREFKDYISDKLKEAKNEFKELLKETKIITHASKNLIKISNHLENIEKALEHDKRYLVLKCVEKERKEILLSYIDKLHLKGPPPPPTATEHVKH